MSRRLVGAAAVALALLTVAGCDPEPSSPTPEDLRDVDISPDHTITVDEDGFDPAELTVTAGEVIEIENAGDEPHSATAVERFDTGRLEPGETTTLVLIDPGTVPYWDVTAPEHTATITIEP